MEFLDEKAEKRHRILLLIGYGLLAVAISTGTLILLYLSYGYSLSTKGEVQQSGIVFVSSNPSGATITANGVKQPTETNSRLNLKSGNYAISVDLNGYRSWRHGVVVQGGEVQRFDYSLLFPKQLSTSTVLTTTYSPSWLAKSLDSRWLLAKAPETDPSLQSSRFILYDLKNASKPVESEYLLPASIATAGEDEAWSPVGWADDNRHVLVLHSFTVSGVQSHEYILIDRNSPSASQNITQQYNVAAEESLTLFDNKYDKYFAFTPSSGVLRSFMQSGDVPLAQINHVKAFKSDGSDSLLYVTDFEDGKTLANNFAVVIVDGSRQMTLRHIPKTNTDVKYLLSLARYNSTRYAAFALPGEKGVYLYRDPLGQTVTAGNFPTPWRLLRTNEEPTTLQFSSNGRFLLSAGGLHCTVYDAELAAVRRSALPGTLDAQQTSSTWFDGYRLGYISAGVFQVVDFDGQNLMSLEPANTMINPFISNDGKYIVSALSGENDTVKLTTTALTVKK